MIDFTENGLSNQNNPVIETNSGGVSCNVFAMPSDFGYKATFVGKVRNDSFDR